MKAVIHKSKATGTAKAPPSKSMAHRLIISAALAKGKSRITGVELSEDIKATLSCLSSLGIEWLYENGTVTIEGTGKVMPTGRLNCNECGSTLRFFIPICMLSEKEATLTGSSRLMERPLSVYESLCKEHGYGFKREGELLTIKGTLKSGTYTVDGGVSSQFISGLLFALPLTDGDSYIKLCGRVESRSYIDMTLSALDSFGVKAYWQNENALYIKGGQRYTATDTDVEGDYSNAAFLSALNLLGGKVNLTGLKEDSLQGDKIYREYFEALKAGCPTLDVSNCPDLAPILMAMAAAMNGATLVGTSRLKIKESDRGAVMAAELLKLGANVTVEENTITVKGGISPPKAALCGHNDHRIVMALSVLLTLFGGEIEGAEAVNKSMPRFFETIKKLGVECDIYE